MRPCFRIALLVVVLSGMTAAAHTDEGESLLPLIPAGSGERCVEETAFMRRNHMDLLDHQRDETMLKGIRGEPFSLRDCLDCHAVYGPGEIPVTAASPAHFCRACHDYAAVSIDCFQCHASRPEMADMPAADRGSEKAMSSTTKDKQPADIPGFDPVRRSFLSAMAAAAGVALAPGVMLYGIGGSATAHAGAAQAGVSGMVRWGMLIDLGRCDSGCDDCVSACAKENGLRGLGRPETDAQWIRKVTLKDKQTGHVQTLPLMCQHCEHPPCVDVCPTGSLVLKGSAVGEMTKKTQFLPYLKTMRESWYE